MNTHKFITRYGLSALLTQGVMSQTPDPGSLRKASSSGVDGRPKMAKIWNERVGEAAKALADGLVTQFKAPGVFEARLKADHSAKAERH